MLFNINFYKNAYTSQQKFLWSQLAISFAEYNIHRADFWEVVPRAALQTRCKTAHNLPAAYTCSVHINEFVHVQVYMYMYIYVCMYT